MDSNVRKNVWESAIYQLKIKNEEKKLHQNESTLIIMGNKKSGKSTLAFRFVEKQETPKSTIALEFLYARHTRNSSTAKDVCYIWELGGATLFTDLLEVPIKSENLMSLSVIIALDLSSPEELWFTFETLIQKASEKIKQCLEGEDKINECLKEASNERIGENHPDKEFLNVFPVPLVILGTKYDLFQEIDPELRKVMTRTLRFLANSYGATLQFVSSKSENLISKSKATFSHICFGTPQSKTAKTEYSKPVFVPFGADTFEAIGGVNSPNDTQGKSFERCLEIWKSYFNTHFPQKILKNIIPEDPGNDKNFQERDIDIMQAQKEKELTEYMRDQKRKENDMDYFEL